MGSIFSVTATFAKAGVLLTDRRSPRMRAQALTVAKGIIGDLTAL